MWINVKDKMPDKKGEYLIYQSPKYGDEGIVSITKYKENSVGKITFLGGLVVSFWQPLPERPKL